jgi:hypothetical protein
MTTEKPFLQSSWPVGRAAAGSVDYELSRMTCMRSRKSLQEYLNRYVSAQCRESPERRKSFPKQCYIAHRQSLA